jgi:heme exporter protein C
MTYTKPEAERPWWREKLPFALLLAGLVFIAFGSYNGLFVAPAEQYMGQTQRIMYIHVPTAWNGMLALTVAFVCALGFLIKGGWKWDSTLEASIEIGVLFCFLLCVQGSIWAKPTWGVWWDWDPRLTTTAVLFFSFLGIVALRHFVEEPVKRATWSAVATVIAYIDLPIVYFSVKWWNSLHQDQSSVSTVSREFWIPIQLNAIGVLLLMTGFIILRSRIAAAKLRTELAPAVEPVIDAPIAILAGGAR